MKKLWKRMTGLLFIGCLFALILSVTAGAEPLYPKTQYYYLNEKVLPYTKPLSSLTISGIKNGTTTNLAGKFAKGHWVSVKQPKTQNNGQISIKAASDWKIISAYYMAEGRNRMLTSERGLNSVTLFAGRMPAGESFRSLTMKFRNSKNGAVIECICQID